MCAQVVEAARTLTANTVHSRPVTPVLTSLDFIHWSQEKHLGGNPWIFGRHLSSRIFQIQQALNPLRMFLHPYPDFPPRTTLPMAKVAIRTAWDNECREYGITDPPVYIRSVPSASAFRKREAESQAVVSEWQTTHSKRFKSTRNARSDGKPAGSLHNHS